MKKPVRDLRLNIGCGIIYRPGYVNIDLYDDRLADLSADALSLPYGPGTVDMIEAEHVLEHLDQITAVYALSEWFRVLRAGGTLCIETPDLFESVGKLRKGGADSRSSTLRWLFGMDSPGMVHKTGFSFAHLKDILGEIGFGNIRKKKQRGHLYEPGLRMKCRKPDTEGICGIMARLRSEIIRRLDKNDSEILHSLEDDFLGELREKLSSNSGKLRNESIRRTTARMAVGNPVIALAFAEVCRGAEMISKREFSGVSEILGHLDDVEFHRRLPALWERTRKEPGRADADLSKFISRQEGLVLELIETAEALEAGGVGGAENTENAVRERLEYLSSLPMVDITVFSFYFVQLQARILFNRGVKSFHAGDLEEALGLFEGSARINPDNPLAYWNMARLGGLLSKGDGWISGMYGRAKVLVGGGKAGKVLDDEMKNYGAGEDVKAEPLSEYSFSR